jgi:hypothetical protein
MKINNSISPLKPTLWGALAIATFTLSGCGTAPSGPAGNGPLSVNQVMAYEAAILKDAFELAHLLSSKKIGGYGSASLGSKDIDTCEGIADAYVSSTNDITLKVRTGTSLSKARFPGKTLIPVAPPQSSTHRKVSLCIRAVNSGEPKNTSLYIHVSTYSQDNWDVPKVVAPGLINTESVPGIIRLKIINAWWQDYKNSKLEFTTAVENGSISSTDATNFLYTYRGFSKDSVRNTEELIFSCLGNGKTDVANILAEQVIEAGATLNPQIIAELKRRKAQR